MAGKVFIKDGMNLREEHLLGLYTIQAEGAFTFDDLRVTFDVNQNKVKVAKGRYWLKNSGGDGLNEPAYYLIGLDTDEFLDEPTTSSKRMDAVVVYLDKTTLVGSGGGGVVHVVIVQGTEGTTNPPSPADIENVVGTSNPYAVLAFLYLKDGESLSDEKIIEKRRFYTMNSAFPGNKNYLMNTNFENLRFAHFCNDWSKVTITQGSSAFVMDGSSSESRLTYDLWFASETELKEGDNIMISGVIKDENSGTGSVEVALYSGNPTNPPVYTKYVFAPDETAGTSERQFVIGYNVPSDSRFQVKIIANRKITVRDVKLEKGKYPTRYTIRRISMLKTSSFNYIINKKSAGGSDTIIDWDAFNDPANPVGPRAVAVQIHAYVGDGADDNTYIFGYRYVNEAVDNDYEFKIKATNQGAYRYEQVQQFINLCNNGKIRFRYRSYNADVMARWHTIKYYE